jgi:filamentous hemagglutinin family protein
MNHTYSLIWNSATRSYVPAPETARRVTKGRFRTLALALAISAACGVEAAPQGGVVVDGSASIATLGDVTNIHQATGAVTINWQGFDIAAGETVNFLQPDASSLALNRVLSGDGTQIHGSLNANGRVFVLDANGVLFGKTAQVNVGSLVASTLDLRYSDDQHFEFAGNGNPAAVINLGQITAADGGAVALLGGQVSNQGIVRARLGSVALAAGNEITLDFAGDGLLNVQIDQAAARALASNGGLIQANGGSVLMTAQASDALLQTVVNNTGVIEARTLQERDGKIMLLGGFDGGTVEVSGRLDASAPEGGDGGFIETSGAVVKVHSNLLVTTDAPQGTTGTWLIDPTNIRISYEGENDGTSHIATQALLNSLVTTNVIVETQAAGSQPGNITIADPVFWGSGNTLTLDAHNNIAINSYIHAPSGGLELIAGGNITTGAEGHLRLARFELVAGNWSQVTNNLPRFNVDDFTLSGGNFTRALAGNGAGTPWQITDIYGLQGLVTTPNANAILVNDIDASIANSWNSGAGFAPIGTQARAFTGNFDGGGHFIYNLQISRAGEDNVGFFGYTNGASITRFGLEGVSVSGNNFVGALVGQANNTSIENIAVAGSVTAAGNNAGGLAGALAADASVANSYSTAGVTASGAAGGLVGSVTDSEISTSYASGAVAGADDQEGGLVGLFDSGSVTTSYWDEDTTNQSTAAGADSLEVPAADAVSGNGGPNALAYSQISYLNLDFVNNWFIAEGSSRPMLRAFLDGGNISNLYQLQGMAANLSGDYLLTGNIDASVTAASVAAGNGGNFSDVWGGRGFAPIHDGGAGFTGSLNGANFEITGLSLNRPNSGSSGLFAVLNNSASVSSLGLVNVDIAGGVATGGLAGINIGTVEGIYISGQVSGNTMVGGLVGISAGSLLDSYSTANVNATADNVGGLVGLNEGVIENAYVTGSVTSAVGMNVGGLVGVNSGGSIFTSYASGSVEGGINTGGLVGNNTGTVENGYWDTYTTGQVNGAGGNSGTITGAELNGEWGNGEDAYNQASYAGFDFGSDWFIAEGYSRPMLRAFLNYTTSGGSYRITNAYQLQGMAADLSGSYVLMNDIDASVIAATGNIADVWGGRGFAPIGNYDAGNTLAFNGSFNGNGHVISGLTIDRPDQDYAGLFGRAWEDASISNVGLVDVSIVGNDNVGALVGWSYANVSGVFVQGGDVTATGSQAGGLIGGNSGTIADSYTDVTVHADGSNAGGLVGLLEDGSIQRTYALGNASAAGANQGALVGQRGEDTAIENSFVLDTAGAGVGLGDNTGVNSLSSAQFMQLSSFAGWSISGQGGSGATWRIYEGHSTPLLRSFLTPITVTAYDDTRVYDGGPYVGLHEINGTSGNGVRYGMNYAQFLAAFGEDGVPYTAPDLLGTMDLEYAGTSQGASNAGYYSLTPTELWSTQLGYDIVISEGELVIDPLTISITLSINDATKIYGDPDPAFSWRITQGAVASGDTAQLTLSRQAGENVGNYTIFGTPVGDLAGGNYQVTINNGVLTITPRSLVIDINDLEKIYGDADPEFTWAISQGSLANGDQLQLALTREAGENVGSYVISANGEQLSSNYNYTINDGVLTITPRPLVLTADNLVKIYGEEDPDLTWSITSGSLVDGDTLVVNISRDDGSNVGVYTIRLNVNAEENGNYTLALVDGQLQITPAQLTITANDVTNYWNLLPAFTATVEGLVNGDTEAGVLGNSLAVTSNMTLPLPGQYVLTPSATQIGNNYTINFVEGVLTLLSSNPGGNYVDALTGTQLPAREALGRELRANIFEGRPLLDGSEPGAELLILDGGVALDAEQLAAWGIRYPEIVFFPVNSSTVGDKYMDELREFAAQLKRFPQVKILVEGHTCTSGSLTLNQKLSQARADSVAKVLSEFGLEQERISAKGYDFQKPYADNRTAEGRSLNRRAEILEDEGQ